MKATLAAVAVTALFIIGSAPSAEAKPSIDKRQANQRTRIRQGVEAGRLTPREAARLRKGQGRVRRLERRAKRDGVLTRREARRLNRAQNRQSRRIRREKTDAQRRRR